MPAVSRAQQQFMAGWEHNPSKMHGKKPNMSKSQMSHYASTPTKGLPSKKKPASMERFGKS